MEACRWDIRTVVQPALNGLWIISDEDSKKFIVGAKWFCDSKLIEAGKREIKMECKAGDRIISVHGNQFKLLCRTPGGNWLCVNDNGIEFIEKSSYIDRCKVIRNHTRYIVTYPDDATVKMLVVPEVTEGIASGNAVAIIKIAIDQDGNLLDNQQLTKDQIKKEIGNG